MMKTTQKDIKKFTCKAGVEDMTYYTFDEVNNIRALEGYFDEVAYSAGTYGITGLVVIGRTTGTFYAITSRTGALFQMM